MTIEFERISPKYKNKLANVLSDPMNNKFNPAPPTYMESLSIIEKWIEFKNQPFMYQVALINKEVVGMGGVSLKTLPDFGEFANLYFRVSHRYINQGIGRSIAMKGIEDARKHAIKCIAITRRNNLPAIGLLKSLGFSEVKICSPELDSTQVCFGQHQF